nr:hypothetical protein Iba_chr14cCG9080 [Ipomoea batatas]GME18147.1 hypothetical protein Iba_scaffold20041CG0010 [Ipomoea batatas]
MVSPFAVDCSILDITPSISCKTSSSVGAALIGFERKRSDKRIGSTSTTSPCNSSNSMDKEFRFAREIKVDNIIQQWDIYSPGCNITTKLFGELEGLKSQISGGREYESSSSSLGHVLLELFEHGDQKCSGFSGASPSHGDDVVAGKDERHGLPLNWGGDSVALTLNSSEHIVAEP